ncbi:MAG: hypothetical protein K6F93_05060 [Lachnospiraceae bacterium]|nr:hypothetical protein [Lachnospiraceae bacterium]
MNKKSQGNSKIPITVGVTGHRDLCEAEIPAIRETVRKELITLRQDHPFSPFVLLCCLAEGADRLCAQIALEEGYDLIAVLPMPAPEYEKNFKGEALESFRGLLGKAKKCIEAPCIEPFREGRDYRYRQADIYLAEHSHLLLAIWDGLPGKENGCGTAETVDIKLTKNYINNNGTYLNPDVSGVVHIKVGRGEEPSAQPVSVTPMGNSAGIRELLRKTDKFNRETEKLGIKQSETGVSIKGVNDTADFSIKGVYDAADSISVRNQKRSRIGLGIVASLATLLTTAFLLYDEAELHILIIMCVVFIAGLFAIVRITRSRGWNEKYTQSRLLAEGLRIQEVCLKAGIVAGAAELLPWTVWTDAPWVAWALKVMELFDGGERQPGAIREFARDQANYHENAIVKTEKKIRKNDRIVRIAVVLSIIAYLAGLGFEIYFGGLLGGPVRLGYEQIEPWRTALKLVMGILSAVTLFVGSYYGKLSLEEENDGHRRMLLLCRRAELRLPESGKTDRGAEDFIRELLHENASWYDYRSRGRAEVNLS